ncbi:ABC-2 type transporter, partial [Helicosporidium sp. ATCC 50920]
GGGATPGGRSARPWAPKNQYALPWLDLTKIVLKRQVVLNIVRSSRFFTARLIQTIIIALIIGSLFWNIPVTPDTWRSSIAVCVLTTIFLAMMSTPHISLVFSTKRVFFKHRDAKFFSASSYVAGLVLTQVPSSTIESIAFAVIVYFMVNFYRAAGTFFIYLLVAWSASNCLAGLFRLVAYFVPTMVAANAGAGMTILLFMITNGFSIVRQDIPPYIVWIYYINPLAWAIRALAINELGSPQWAVPVSPSSSETIGEVALDAFGLGSNRAYIWGAVGIQWGMLILYSILGVLALKYTNPPPPKASVSPEDARLSVEAGVLSQSGRQDNLSRRAMSQLSSMFFLGSSRSREGGETGGSRDKGSLAGGPNPADAPLATTYEEGALSGVLERTVLPFPQCSLVCRDIRYYVPDPSKGMAPGVVKGSDDPAIEGKLQLLKGVSLHAVPGDLLALMGGSGAGKTTLMDVIAGRKTIGLIRGDIFVNGHLKQQASWSRVMGYVEQTDIHTSAVTVRESLLFSARLRLGREHDMKTVQAVVDETLELVELSSRQQSIVGEPGGVGLSLEQRKRLSIAVELVANPSVVFMDEPTSGLDARAAAIVMRAVRNVADSRRTVMVTIHQPSLELFEAFDSLILLQRGGRVTYFGPLGAESASLLGYLQAVPGVEPCRPGYNPATWMLEVTGGSMSTTFAAAEHDFPQLYADSQLRRDNDAAAEAARARAEKEHEPLSVGTRFAASYGTQVYWLTRKFFKVYWHLPSYNMVRLCLTLVIALIYGVTYLHKGDLDRVADGQPLTVAAVQNIAGLSFSMVMFLGMFNCMTVQPVVYAERIVFYRERAASMYSPGPYSFATTVVELPYLLTQTVIMIGIAYFMVGLQIAWTPLVLWFVAFGLTLQLFTGFGVLCVYATPHILVAMLLTSGINQLWTFFNGFLIPFDQIPHGWKWMNRISPTTWVLYGLVGSQLSDRDNPMIGLDGEVTTVGAFVTSYFGYEYSFIWWCVLIIFAYALAFRVMSVLFLKYVNFQRR